MKPSRPLSYDVGPYVVREDAGQADGARIARVFSGSVAIFSGLLIDALRFAHEKRDEYAMAMTVRCPICGSRPGSRCFNNQGTMRVPHVARVDARERLYNKDA